MARSAPPLFERFRGRARKLVDLPDKLVGLVTQALNKASRLSHRPARLDAVWEDLKTCIDLLRAWSRGDYRDVSNDSIVIITAAVLYFVVPFDLVFDGILGLGYLDDATVLAYAISCAGDEIEAFRRWVNGNNDAQHQDGAARAGGES